MNNQEFIQQKQKCWEEFIQKYEIGRVDGVTANAFVMAFDRAYALGKQEKDAEEGEMLTVPRKKVKEKWQRAYEQEAQYSRAQDSPVARLELYYNRGILSILDTLFGSKCLPDTEPILQPFSQVKKTATSTIPVTESDKLSKLNDALLKLEEASKQVIEELTKLNEK